jgi:hypothetical protein
MSEYQQYGPEWQKEMMNFPKAEAINLCASFLDTKQRMLDTIAEYAKGHEEPGHECVLCLIEAMAKGEIRPL